jgi:SPP1 gp7 family putative phage head morphogenesis protein
MLIYPKVKIQYPMSLEREYARELVKYVRKVRDICKRHIPNMVDAAMWNAIRADDWTEEQTEEIDNEITAEEEAAIMAIILAMFNRVKTFNRRQQEKIFRSVFGASPKEISKEDYEKIKQIWVNQNIELIHSIDRRTLESIRYALSENIVRAVDREILVKELTDSIMHMAEVNEKRAALIACDQVGKLNSQLVQLEQMSQGADSYIWITMKDNRVRPAHREREGKRFYWNNPPSDGHPGWAYRCRCTAIPQYDTDKIGLQPKAGSYKKV